MSKPADLISKVFRPVRDETPEPAPTSPVAATTIERIEYRPDGSILRYTFDPQRGEREEIISADDAALVRPPTPMAAADALAVEMQLEEQGVR